MTMDNTCNDKKILDFEFRVKLFFCFLFLQKKERFFGSFLATKKNKNFNTSEFEREIDLAVYRLYGLSDDEIEIVEGK